ncbi:MAG: aminopeptidase P family protein [Hyphomicrobiaceae bacterium]|nr:aminopeptidase P family protein [Hyphomicrobiaceae bacterium]
MFQSFENIADPSKGQERVAELRTMLKARKLAAFLVPRADEFQNEYTPPNAERLFWLTGFSGSAGSAIVARKTAALFVDGRYTLQAAEQVNTKVFEILQVPQNDPADWLKKTLKQGDVLGYDPRLHTIKAVERLKKTVGDAGARLEPQITNPLDSIWKQRPPPPQGKVFLHPLEFAGVPPVKKIAAIQKDLRKAKLDAVVLTAPESICWLLNIRGQDVPHTPLVLCFAIVPAKGLVDLFIDPGKISPTVRKHLKADARVLDAGQLPRALETLGKADARVLLDPDQASQWIADQLVDAGAALVHKADPCLAPKAKKNPVEIAGARTAHKRDGVAVCRFLAWLDANAPAGKLDEIAAAKKLEAFRAQTGELKDISFDTISGAGANGAIVHYRVSKATNAKLKPGSLYLVDSGAQFLDGTTDITRTIAVGEPAADMRRHFTLVLRGHIAIAVARFPKGTRGADLDPLAREPLWKAGMDFDHGTGHGIGSYLSVHEGPQGISKRGGATLVPGMICSNEPGYYREGEYGIRIENLVLVTRPRKVRGGDRPMMGFETLTLAPIDRRLVDVSMLSDDELRWLNAYHARVLKEIGPELKGRDRAWLEQATMPLEGS